MPAELNQPIPRRTKPKRFYVFVFIFFSTLAFGVLLFSTLVPYYSNIYPIKTLQERGSETSARIIDLYINKYYRKGWIVEYHAKYSFFANLQSNRQGTILGDGTVSLDQYQNLMIGSAIPVVYDPQQPLLSMLNTKHKIQMIDPYRAAIITAPLFLLILSVPGSVFFIQLASYRRQRWLLKWGQIASAIIIDEADDSTGKRYSKLTYRFSDANGETVEGTAIFAPIARNPARLTILQNPTVLFDPSNSRKNLLYPAMFVASIPRDDASQTTS